MLWRVTFGEPAVMIPGLGFCAEGMRYWPLGSFAWRIEAATGSTVPLKGTTVPKGLPVAGLMAAVTAFHELTALMMPVLDRSSVRP